MTSTTCTCPLADYQMTVADNGKPICTMTNIAKGLGHSIRGQKGDSRFAEIVKAYPSRFTSSAGISGYQLLNWSNRFHRQGLVEMTHEFLCTSGNGPLFWPGENENEYQDSLRYPEHKNEIFEEMVRLFFKINDNQRAKRKRLSRLRRASQDHGQILNAGSVDGRPPIRDVLAEGPMSRPTKSPDDLNVDSPSQRRPTNNPRRRVKRRRDHRGSWLFDAYSDRGHDRTSAGPSHRREQAPTDELAERPRDAENATMTDLLTQSDIEMENTTHNRAGDGPPQPMNIGRASEGQAGAEHDNRALWPSSGQSREVPQSRQGLMRGPSEPPAQAVTEQASPTPEPKTSPILAPATPAVIHGVHIIISVQTFPWLNQTWYPRRDFFQYTLKTLFEDLPWQEPFYKVIMLLEFPGGVIIEDVQRDDEMGFRIVLARFEQKIETLRMCYAAPDKDIVLEVSLEPVGRYQEPSERVRALLGRHIR
ncbi:hypothetical protein NCS52_01102900 [Fusarium sp. LHS14.1]|nr:hypothetical protein NCS52_01102900 [Fusarium sp. LHS14.1]